MSFFETLDDYVGGAIDVIGGTRDRIVSYSNDALAALDFGFADAMAANADTRQNPEMDLTEYDRSNPTNLNSFMDNKALVYGAAGVAALAVLLLLARK